MLRQFTHPLALLLWLAATLAAVSGTIPLAMAILAVIVLNAALAFVQEQQAERAVEALAAYLPANATAIRDGVRTVLPARGGCPTRPTRRRTSPTSGTNTPSGGSSFFAWLKEITTVLDELAQLAGRGLPTIAARMSESFGTDPIRLSVERYGQHLRQQREAGALRMSGTGLLTTSSGITVPQHTFHGQYANSRR